MPITSPGLVRPDRLGPYSRPCASRVYIPQAESLELRAAAAFAAAGQPGSRRPAHRGRPAGRQVAVKALLPTISVRTGRLLFAERTQQTGWNGMVAMRTASIRLSVNIRRAVLRDSVAQCVRRIFHSIAITGAGKQVAETARTKVVRGTSLRSGQCRGSRTIPIGIAIHGHQEVTETEGR